MRKILKGILILFIVSIIGYTILGIYKENSIKQKKSEIDIQKINYNQSANNGEVQEKRNLNLVPKQYKGYKVAAKLKIKKLDIDTPVLSEYTKEAMNVCVTKFYGADANEIGNFCITGHNYITKNMFGYLYKLKVGDTLVLSDNNYGVVEYKIYDIYRAEANETYRIISKNKWKKRSNLNNML